jgi:hypothetical protein
VWNVRHQRLKMNVCVVGDSMVENNVKSKWNKSIKQDFV